MKTQNKHGLIFFLLAFAIVLTVFSFFIPKSSNKVNHKPVRTNENQKPWEMDWGNNQSAEIEYRRNEAQNTAQQQVNTNDSYDTSSQNINIPTNYNSSSIYVANPEIKPERYISRTNNSSQYEININDRDNSVQEIYPSSTQNNNVEYSSNNHDNYENSTSSYSVPMPHPTPAPTAPTHMTSCDGSGCWDNQGNRYNGNNGTYFNNGRVCRDIGGQMQCN